MLSHRKKEKAVFLRGKSQVQALLQMKKHTFQIKMQQEILELHSPFLAVLILTLPGICLWSHAVSKNWLSPLVPALPWHFFLPSALQRVLVVPLEVWAVHGSYVIQATQKMSFYISLEEIVIEHVRLRYRLKRVNNSFATEQISKHRAFATRCYGIAMEFDQQSVLSAISSHVLFIMIY